ncbi:hypothetical protein BT93_L4864 [Corymbia citriodora subsp. variegata]|uniref:Uncharacterized protein n=1 Tax=Corymbia citriodora subsp. variegata TaxID=360336 RepID=A0A8T0CFJ6_CORYI|nr:hypothetical protein BT93_L4864 [Corymbia citriodora subsp. variegata]
MAAVPPSAVHAGRPNGIARPTGAARPNGAVKANGTPTKPRATPTRPPVPRAPKAASVSGESPVNGVTSAYAIMANRIANRVAEMAESITFVERPKGPQQNMYNDEPQEKKRPRKLEMRLENSGSDAISFSAPFLDNTLQKMLLLQNRMLKSSADLAKSEGVDEKVVKEQAAQSAELSRIIALICAEKARQGA